MFDLNETGTGTMEVIGKPNLYFTYRRLAFIPTKELNNLMKKHGNQLINSEILTVADFIEDNEENLEQMISLIVDWNLEYNGKKFELPSENPKIWEQLPNLYNNIIINTIKNDPTNINVGDVGKPGFLPDSQINMGTLKMN